MNHFPNFNLDMPICNDIVMDISTKYDLDKSEVIFLINFINSNMYSIRNSNLKKKVKSKYLINKINKMNELNSFEEPILYSQIAEIIKTIKDL